MVIVYSILFVASLLCFPYGIGLGCDEIYSCDVKDIPKVRKKRLVTASLLVTISFFVGIFSFIQLAPFMPGGVR